MTTVKGSDLQQCPVLCKCSWDSQDFHWNALQFLQVTALVPIQKHWWRAQNTRRQGGHAKARRVTPNPTELKSLPGELAKHTNQTAPSRVGFPGHAHVYRQLKTESSQPGPLEHLLPPGPAGRRHCRDSPICLEWVDSLFSLLWATASCHLTNRNFEISAWKSLLSSLKIFSIKKPIILLIRSSSLKKIMAQVPLGGSVR